VQLRLSAWSQSRVLDTSKKVKLMKAEKTGNDQSHWVSSHWHHGWLLCGILWKKSDLASISLGFGLFSETEHWKSSDQLFWEVQCLFPVCVLQLIRRACRLISAALVSLSVRGRRWWWWSGRVSFCLHSTLLKRRRGFDSCVYTVMMSSLLPSYVCCIIKCFANRPFLRGCRVSLWLQQSDRQIKGKSEEINAKHIKRRDFWTGSADSDFLSTTSTQENLTFISCQTCSTSHKVSESFPTL